MNLKNSPTLKSSKIRVGLTIGDPAGIGPAIALKAIEILKNKAVFTVIGDRLVLAKTAKILKTNPNPFKFIDLNNVAGKEFKFGSLNAPNGRASLEYLDTALELLKMNKIDCLVTCPVSKEAINLAGFKFSGHTEYLGQQTGSSDLVMMLINDKIRFSLLTRHIPLQDVCRSLKPEAVRKNLLNTVAGLKNLFHIKKPRLVVCGVNPHASDNGVIGAQEGKILIPVIKNLNRRPGSFVIKGPLSADVAIAQAAKGKFDCAIAAYHDQALIALKLTGFNSGVNLTLGLPFVRTSPLHGTAFDIAGNPALADCGSLVAAIRLAIKCTLNRKKV
ncbi:MAG: 4-hydroxythreonine-4-phosphate dehydrogenase PdxA [Candidatus Omnitrophica bacterium CG11_big_fil_rev_8_21_14_0_20_43_6]|nr:MAG: 4-hydroxythreonine-4-phosphate dehydrogenase PdxA [Candidatus Omnitrophica bacterium CG11_big_fil_rev_8_21_14_0_20_43_6]